MARAKIPEIYLVWPHGPKASLSTGRWRFDGKGVDMYRDRCSRLICFECTFYADRRSPEVLRPRLISMHISMMCDHLLRLIPRLWSTRFRALIFSRRRRAEYLLLLPLLISYPHTQGEGYLPQSTYPYQVLWCGLCILQ